MQRITQLAAASYAAQGKRVCGFHYWPQHDAEALPLLAVAEGAAPVKGVHFYSLRDSAAMNALESLLRAWLVAATLKGAQQC